MTQLHLKGFTFDGSCELLSNLYLCIGWHSSSVNEVSMWTVVNCFQICIFVSDDTAKNVEAWHSKQLWIAFKFVSLYRMTQPAKHLWRCKRRCELLSNLYLCIGWHSRVIIFARILAVVNCFQICIFVSDDTAYYHQKAYLEPLWIAFKFVSLYRMTQLLLM